MNAPVNQDAFKVSLPLSKVSAQCARLLCARARLHGNPLADFRLNEIEQLLGFVRFHLDRINNTTGEEQVNAGVTAMFFLGPNGKQPQIEAACAPYPMPKLEGLSA